VTFFRQRLACWNSAQRVHRNPQPLQTHRLFERRPLRARWESDEPSFKRLAIWAHRLRLGEMAPIGALRNTGRGRVNIMTNEDEIRAASEQFYAALNRTLNGDAGSLREIWSHAPTVTTMHPIGGREVGWDQVRNSWEQVARLSTGGQVKLSDQFIQVAGDAAYELGVEHGRFTLAGHPVAGDCRVTNIYRRESGAWKIVHHHTDTAQSMIDAVGRSEKRT
jgi:ketosteroid isomerase-like protein